MFKFTKEELQEEFNTQLKEVTYQVHFFSVLMLMNFSLAFLGLFEKYTSGISFAFNLLF